MRKIAGLLSLVLLLLLGAVGCGQDDTQLQAIRDRGALRVGVKVDVPNFGYLNPATNQLEGLEIDLARLIAQEIIGDAEAVELVGVTAQMRGPLLDNGEVDIVIATFTITEERRESYNFTEPYYHDEIGLLVRRDSGIESLADMDGKTVAVAQTSTTRDALVAEGDKLGIAMQYKEYASYPEMKAALVAGETDAFSVDKSILSGYADEDTVILADGFNPQDYGIASKLENDQLAAFLTDFLKTLKADGRMDEILQRWGQAPLA